MKVKTMNRVVDREAARHAAKRFGQHLRLLRAQRGLTQSRAGELVGVDGFTVRRLELGIFSPSGENLQHLAEIYGLTIEDLLSAATIDNGHKPSTRVMVTGYLAAGSARNG